MPADAKPLEGEPVEVDQSALTGESLPATRKTGEEVYSGSILKRGELDATVTATGKDTYFGQTAQLVESAGTVSHFLTAVLKIGNYLIALAVVLAALIVVLALVRGDKLATTLQCLAATSTRHAPWFVVPADDKANARLIVSQAILDALDGLKMSYPKTTPERREELKAIRAKLAK